MRLEKSATVSDARRAIISRDGTPSTRRYAAEGSTSAPRCTASSPAAADRRRRDGRGASTDAIGRTAAWSCSSSAAAQYLFDADGGYTSTSAGAGRIDRMDLVAGWTRSGARSTPRAGQGPNAPSRPCPARLPADGYPADTCVYDIDTITVATKGLLARVNPHSEGCVTWVRASRSSGRRVSPGLTRAFGPARPPQHARDSTSAGPARCSRSRAAVWPRRRPVPGRRLRPAARRRDARGGRRHYYPGQSLVGGSDRDRGSGFQEPGASRPKLSDP